MFLKFRAWDSYKNKMTTNFILAPTSPDWAPFPIERPDDKAYKDLKDMEIRKGYFLPCGDYTLTDWANYYGIEHYKVMMFIGLKDKNGKEIYEGDIIQYIGDFGQICIGQVQYIGNGFWVKEKDGTCFMPSICEVIGNIYENPELIKGE